MTASAERVTQVMSKHGAAGRRSLSVQGRVANTTTGVGYGRPPEHTRFAKGISGNPKGRPKGSRNFRTIIRDLLTAKIVVREGEKLRSVSKLEGIVLKQAEGALKGSDRAALATLKMAAQVGLLGEQDGGAESISLTASEQQMLAEFLSSDQPNGRRQRQSKRRAKG